MTGKQRVIAAVKYQETDRIPWLPFVGCHAGALLGKTAEEYLNNADLNVQGVKKAVEMYQPDYVKKLIEFCKRTCCG